MGFRTVVMLSNDWAHEWEKDPELGKKISRAASMLTHPEHGGGRVGDYGAVVECVHGDTQTIAVVDGYTGFFPVAYSMCHQHRPEEQTKLELLKRAADEMGVRLVKKPVKNG